MEADDLRWNAIAHWSWELDETDSELCLLLF